MKPALTPLATALCPLAAALGRIGFTLGLSLSLAAQAQNGAAKAEPGAVAEAARSAAIAPKVTATATRIEAVADDLPVTVSVIAREELNRRPALDEADLFRDEPDVVMARDLRRHGATSVNIRGIEGNRVVQTVDGVRMADPYDKSGPTNYVTSSALGLMPDFLRQVDVVRGPASSLYGSDALGGVVGYVSLNPADLLRAGARSGGLLKATWTQANGGLGATALGAWRGQGLALLLGLSHIRRSELQNQGSDDRFGPDRTRPNPLEGSDRGILAKLELDPAANHRLVATVDARRQQADSDIRRQSADYARVTSMQGDDRASRVRASLDYEHKARGSFYDRLNLRLSHQRNATHNTNTQRRENTVYYFNGVGCAARGTGKFSPVYMPGTMPFDPRGWAMATCDMEQDFELQQTQTALNLQLSSAVDGEHSSHFLSYGLDVQRQNVQTRRDGTVTLGSALAPIQDAAFGRFPKPVGVNPMNPPPVGTVTKNIAGEDYPLRDFPNGDTHTLGVYLQDEIGLLDQRLRLTPGVRYDHTRLSPKVDALAAATLDAMGRQASAQSHGQLSPKLGWQWKLSPSLLTYGQLARGFRAPNYNEVNGSFRNLVFGYGIVPNPDLKPETSLGLELGVRAQGRTARAQLSVYDNRYRDFIDSVYLDCPSNPDCLPHMASGTLQSQNLNKVRIYGAELRTGWTFAPGWQADAALAYAHGQDVKAQQPLDSVEPLRASLGLVYARSDWGAEGRVRAAQRKTRIDSRSALYATPGYGVLDLAAWVQPLPGLRLTLALNNVLDKTYWLWSDVRHMDVQTSTPGVDFYSQPGRNVRLSASVQF